MLVTSLKQVIALDKRGPYDCALCGEPVGLPAIFTIGNDPGSGVFWLHVTCGNERGLDDTQTRDRASRNANSDPAAIKNRFGGSW